MLTPPLSARLQTSTNATDDLRTDVRDLCHMFASLYNAPHDNLWHLERNGECWEFSALGGARRDRM
jgi:hypothetical protein